MGADVLVRLAEAVFAYMDELSSASVEGYAFEQTLQVGESGRLRNALLALLVQPGADEATVADAARRAGWSPPARVVAVVVPEAHAEGLAGALGPAALVGELQESTVALVPAPRGAAARARVEAVLAGRDAVVGPPRPWASAGVSLRLARLASRLLPAGAAPLDVAALAPRLLLLTAPELMDDLAERRLAPLQGLRPGTADRLAETLLSWLRHRGERQRVAAELHVHTQTVGYRLTQLRELFGDALEDPEARLELELALRHRAG